MNRGIPSTKQRESVKVGLRDLLILGAAALILGLPMLLFGPMVNGHDAHEHLNYCRNFAEQFWGGEWSPRWLLNMCHGLGSPSLFVYPPFGCYVVTLLQPLGKLFHFNAFNAGAFLSLFASGVGAFLWVHTAASRRVALVSASLYMLLPYHLSVDFYRRTALSECWALVWMPVVLYFTTLVMARKRTALLGIAVAYALLILSHLVSVLIFSLIPLTLALVLFAPGKKVEAALRVAAGMTLGTGLSCFYLLPALLQAKHFPVLSSLHPPYYFLENNFISLADLTDRSAMGGFVFWVSVTAISVMLFITISSISLLSRPRSDSRPLVLFWSAVCIAPVFLMWSISLPVWHRVVPLFKGVQYPWRFSLVLCLAALFFTAQFLSRTSQFSRLTRVALLGALSAIVLTWVLSYGQVWKRYRTDVYTPSARQLVSDDDGWFDSWTAPGVDQGRALQASAEPRVRFLGVTGTSEVRLWKARHIEFQTDSPTGGWVEINQFYYPGWTASAETIRLLEIKTVLPEGLMEVQVPAGRQAIRVELPPVTGERAGEWISLASLLLCGFVAWRIKPPQSLAIASGEHHSSSQTAVAPA
jgi:hypothetical protein